MKRSGSVRRLRVSADGVVVVSHAGLGMLRELAEDCGLVTGLSQALADTYRGRWLHAPGRFTMGKPTITLPSERPRLVLG